VDVRLPNGEVITNVPDDMSRADLVVRLRRNGHDLSWLEPPAPAQPQQAQSGLDSAAPAPAPGLAAVAGISDKITEVGKDVGGFIERSAARLVGGVAEAPAAAARIAENATGAMLGTSHEEIGAPRILSGSAEAAAAPARDWAKTAEAEAVAALSPEARRALELSLVEQEEETGALRISEGASNPYWWTANVIDVGMQAIPGLAVGGASARMAYAARYRQVLGEMSGMKIPQSVAIAKAEKEALAAAKKAAMISGGLVEGVAAGGQNAAGVREVVESLNEETLMAYPGYLELRDKGMTHEQARNVIAKDKAAAVAIATGAATAMTGAPMNAFFGQLTAKFGRAVDPVTMAQRAKTAAKGVAGEAAQEFVQEGSDQLIQNKALQPITGVETWDGVLEGAVTGAVLGGVIGGGAGVALGGKSKKGTKVEKPTPKVEGDSPAPPATANIQSAKAAFDAANLALAEAEIAARDPEINIKYADLQKLREAKKQAVVDYTRELLHAGMIAEENQAKVTAALKQAEAEGLVAKGTSTVGGDVSPARDAALEAVAGAQQLEEADANDLISRGWAKVNPRGVVILTPEGRRQRKAAQERAKLQDDTVAKPKAESSNKRPPGGAGVKVRKPTLKVPADRSDIAQQREAQRALQAQKPRKELRAEKATLDRMAKRVGGEKIATAYPPTGVEVDDIPTVKPPVSTPAALAGRARELEASEAAHVEFGTEPMKNPAIREAFKAAAARSRRARAGLPDNDIPAGNRSRGAFRLKGAPETVDIPGHGKVKVEPVPAAKTAAANYRKAKGITAPEQTEFARVDPARAKRIAKAFDEMKHEPNNPTVKRAYRAMIDETKAQWDEIKKSGLKVEFIKPGQKDPYAASPRMAIEDVRKNNHLWVFPTDSGFGTGDQYSKDNPMLEDAGEVIGSHSLKNNDIFRIVHDYFGHVAEANGFRADGEENAWRIHASMYSPLARRAMTTETRGQNSWVNYGPKGEANRKASSAETVYADQKIGLLPAEFSAFPGETLKFKHFSNAKDDQIDLDPELMGTGAKGAEAKRGGPKVVSLYAEHGETEPDVASGRTRYNVEIAKEDLYDGSTDPQGLLRQAQVPFGLTQDAQGNMVPVGHRFDMNKFEELVRDAGYLGYHLPEATGILKGQARIFQKYPATRDGFVAQDRATAAARMKAKVTEETVKGHLTEQERERLHKASAKKLVEVFNELPSGAELAAAAVAGQAKRGWYRRSAEALSNVFGPDAPRFAALLAALSPQTSVEWNFKNAVAVWVGWDKAGRPTDRKTILFLMRENLFPGTNKVGRSKVLGAWVNNTVRALSTDDPSAVVLSGPKVDSFAANLRGETERVTLDAWMANWAGVDQTLFKGEMNVDGTNPGMRPGYLAFAARVREAAQILSDRTGETWTPAEVQETVWSWAKTLYEQAESFGALATARELVDNNELTDELINATPDFAGQFEDPEIASLLRGTVYGPRASRSAGQAAAAGRTAGKTAPAAEDARYLRKAADRLDALRKSRKEAEDVTREESAAAMKQQTETPEFKAWFGNSKVVNPDGTPMIMYHATAADFDTFRRRPGDIGLHFGTQEQAADRFNYGRERGRYDESATESVIPIYLSIRNPLRMNDMGAWNAENMGSALNRLFPEAREQIFRMRSAADVRKFLQARGYDGIVYKNTGEVNDAARGKELRAEIEAAERALGPKWRAREYHTRPEYKAYVAANDAYSEYRHGAGSADSFIAFERTQVKSAVGNSGAFNPKDPNITARMGSRPERGLPMADLQQVADRVTRELGVTANVANTQADLPDYIAVNIPDGAVVTGMFVEDPITGETEIWYVHENIDSVDEAYENALHEAVGHMGLRAVLGDSYHKVMADIRRSFPEKVEWAARQNQIDVEINAARSRGDHAAVRRLESLAAEELVAYAAGKVLQKRGALSRQSVWRRIVAKVRDILRNVGLLNKYSGEDIEALIYRARDYFRKPAKTRAQEINYRARMAAAMKQQPDGAPQWLDADEYLAEDDLNPAPELEDQATRAAELRRTNPSIRPAGEMVLEMKRRFGAAPTPGAPVEEQIVFPPNFDSVMAGNEPFEGQTEVEAFADGRRIGYVTMSEDRRDDDGWSAEYVYVHPDYRGKGVAQRMYKAISDKLGVPVKPSKTQTGLGKRMWDSFGRRKIAFRMKEAAKKQTETDAFKEWFGDSKVVDENGNPLRVFHGTSADFSAFDTDQPPSRANPAWSGDIGSWFAGESKYKGNYDEGNAEFVAENFAGFMDDYVTPYPGASIIPVYLSIKNPIEFEDFEHFQDERDETRAELRKTLGRKATGRDYRDYLISKGYDGMVIRNSMTDGNVDRDDWVAFRPTQIKSAVGNLGTFDPTNPNIAFAFKQGPTGSPDLDSFISKIGVRPQSLRDRWQAFKHGLSERAAMALFDELHGIKAAETIAGVPEAEQGYVSARLSRAAPEVVASIIEHGPPVWNDGAPDIGQGMSLLSILAPLKGNVNLWLTYMSALRAQRLKTEGRENLFTPAEIAAGVALGQQHPEFAVARQQYNRLQKQVLDFAEEAGVIDPQTRAMWEHADYIPFHRIMQGGEVVVPSKAGGGIGFIRNQIKQLKGGRQNIGDPLENIVRNWQSLMEASLQAVAGRMTIDNLNGTGLVTPSKYVANVQPIQNINALLAANPSLANALQNAGINIATTPPAAIAGLQKMLGIAPPAGEDVVTVWRDGKREYWHVHDPNLFSSLKNINPKLWGPWMKLFAFPKRVVTKTITITPQFMVKNFWRDMWHTFVTGAQSDQTRIKLLPTESIAGLASALANSPEYRSMVAGGGGFGESFVESGDPESMAGSVRRAISKGTSRSFLLDTPVKAWRFYRSLQNAAENANRVAVYKKGVAAGLSRRNALYQARDLMDFSMRGNAEIVRLIVGMTPFFNARLQGLYRLGRGFKQSFASVAIRGLLLSAASIALLARNHDDERYKALTDQQKSNYWHFFTDDGHYMLPKPFEVGTIFGTIPEALGDAMLTNVDQPDGTKQAAKLLGYSFGETLSLAPQPATVWPLVELAINQDTFTGAPILTQGDEAVLPEDQRGPNTSAFYAAVAGMVPSDSPEALRSPKQLEHLGRGYIGNVQDYVLLAADALTRRLTGEPTPPEKAVRDLPGIRDFYRTGPARNTRHITEMYKLADEAAKIGASITRNEKADTAEGDARIEELETENETLLSVAEDFKEATSQVTELKKEQRQIQLDPAMTPADKRAAIDEIQQEINDIAKDVYDLRPGGKLNPETAAELLTAPPTARATILRNNNMPATADLLEQVA
jgi:GNAT superfamily N-acetyltransferase